MRSATLPLLMPITLSDRQIRWLWIAALLILTLIFMGRVLLPPEGYAVGGLDVRGLFFPWLTYARQAIFASYLPFWNPDQFGGYPFLANPQVAFFYPPTWLAILLPVRIGISWYLVLHLWLAGVGMLLLLHFIDASWLGAGLAALTYMFSGFIAARIYAGHIGVIATDAWLPWILLATAWAVRRGDLLSAVVAGLPVGLAILAGHATSLIYVGIAWLGFIIYLAASPRGERLKDASHLNALVVLRQTIIAGIVGLALSAIQLIPFLQASQLSTRAAAPDLGFATLFSMPPAHLIALALPKYFGDPIVGYRSTPNFEEFSYYAGILPLLAILLAFHKPRTLTIYALILMVLGIVLSLGTHNPLYGMLTPLLRFERVPARAAFLFTFGVSVLVGAVISQWESDRNIEAKLQNLAILRAISAALIAFVLIDLWLFGYKLVALNPIAPAAIWTDAKQIIGETDERVLPWGVSIFEQNGAQQVGLKNIFSYNALEIAANQAFLASKPDPRATPYDILNVGYVIAGGPLDDYTQDDHALKLIGNTDSAWVYRRKRVMPLARLVYDVAVVTSELAVRDQVNASDFRPRKTVLMTEPPDCTIGPEPSKKGTTQITAHNPTRWIIHTESAAPALLVLSETAYPGWQVTVDGTPARALTAYTAIRAVCVPAGLHEVIWIYSPRVYLIGGVISILALISIIVCSAAVWRQQKVNSDEQL